MRSPARWFVTLFGSICLCASSSRAFNTFDDAQDYTGTVCITGPDNYHEEIGPGETSKGWYYTKGSSLHLGLASKNYAAQVNEEGVTIIVCNNPGAGGVCSIPAHGQQVIYGASCFGNSDKAAVDSCILLTNRELTYTQCCGFNC